MTPSGPPHDRPSNNDVPDPADPAAASGVPGFLARFGSTPGQVMSRILLVAGLLLMLYVIVVVTRALS